MSIRSSLLVGAVLAQALASPAGASIQGAFGPTSTGSVNINASVPGRVRISGLTDFNFANSDPSSDVTGSQNVCVWSNTSTRGYSITATGSGTGSAFTLSDGSNLEVPYSVEWADLSGQSSGTTLASSAALTGQISSAINSDCSAGPPASASLIVSIDSSTLQSMVAGVDYTGSLTLVVAPE